MNKGTYSIIGAYFLGIGTALATVHLPNSFFEEPSTDVTFITPKGEFTLPAGYQGQLISSICINGEVTSEFLKEIGQTVK